MTKGGKFGLMILLAAVVVGAGKLQDTKKQLTYDADVAPPAMAAVLRNRRRPSRCVLSLICLSLLDKLSVTEKGVVEQPNTDRIRALMETGKSS